MTKEQLGRSIQSCTCGLGDVFHKDGYCDYPDHPKGKRTCSCKSFDLNWYIENHKKFNALGEIIH